MIPLDSTIHECRALVIDGNPTSRSVLMAMLRDFGLKAILQCGRAVDARRILEERQFDIVLCEQHFDDEVMGGQDLLDDLRRNNLLPFYTVFIMVTGEATYAKVAEAAESALDSYLLKPHNSHMLSKRLKEARHRKRVLQYIFTAIEEERYSDAAMMCKERFEQRGEFWLYAARVGAELFLRIGDHDEARRMFEAVRQARALPWAKLGIARAEMAGGSNGQAKRTLESLIADNPGYADAYDVMGRVQVENGDFAGALETYRRACEITPSSVSRLQKNGVLAFYNGEFGEAERLLDRATSLGISSKMYDLQSLVLLALLKFDAGDTRGMARTIDNIKHRYEKNPDSVRLRRFFDLGMVMQNMVARQVARVVEGVRDLATEILSEDFDFECAGNLLALLTRLSRTEIQLPDGEIWVARIGKRFCTSKTSSELLAANCISSDEYQDLIRAQFPVINKLAEQAVEQSVKGSPQTAVQTLLKDGEKTLNAKLIDLAIMVLNRHRERVDLYEPMMAKARDLHDRYCTKGTRMLMNEQGRSAGALALRTGATPATGIATPPSTTAIAA